MLKIFNNGIFFWASSISLLLSTLVTSEIGEAGYAFLPIYLAIFLAFLLSFLTNIKIFSRTVFISTTCVFIFFIPILMIMTFKFVSASNTLLDILSVFIYSGLIGMIGMAGFVRVRRPR
jgi:hypothetical protein